MIENEWLKKYADKVRKADYIDPALYRKYGVKRGLRNDDGTGVLVGLTTIGNVHGYVVDEGEKKAVPGELYYRGISVKDLVVADRKEHRYGYEEAAYLLMFGDLPTAKQLKDWRRLPQAVRRLQGKRDSASSVRGHHERHCACDSLRDGFRRQAGGRDAQRHLD